MYIHPLLSRQSRKSSEKQVSSFTDVRMQGPSLCMLEGIQLSPSNEEKAKNKFSASMPEAVHAFQGALEIVYDWGKSPSQILEGTRDQRERVEVHKQRREGPEPPPAARANNVQVSK
jgi:hypothetical protein